MLKIAFTSFIAVILTGCAATYKPPTGLNNSIISKTIPADKYQLFNATQKALALRGDQISNANYETGIIFTTPRSIRLTPETADCGKTMGLDYLKDNRTNSKIHFNIIVDNNKVTIKGMPTAEYRVGAVDQDMTLTCISKGILEQNLLNDIKQAL